MEDYERIELRSEKVRNIIGRIPPMLIRIGITFICLLLIALFAAAWFIPYPESIKTQAEITAPKTASVYIPYRYITQIKKEMPVEIELEGYNARTYGYLKARITAISSKVEVRDGDNFFIVTVQLLPSPGFPALIEEHMKGNAFILLANKSIARHLINK